MNVYQQLVQSDRPAEHDPQRAPGLAKLRIAPISDWLPRVDRLPPSLKTQAQLEASQCL